MPPKTGDYSTDAVDLGRCLRGLILGKPVPLDVMELENRCLFRAGLLARNHPTQAETEIQCLLVAALRQDSLTFPQPGIPPWNVPWGIVYVHHSPNGGNRSQREGAELKRAGVVAGWPDLDLRMVTVEGARQSCLLELKTRNGRLSDNQRIVVPALQSAGFTVAVSRGLQEMVTQVSRWLHPGVGNSTPGASTLEEW